MGKDKGGGGGSRGAPVVTLEQFADALITSSSSSSSSSGAKSGRGGGGGGGKHAHKPLAKGVESLTLRDDAAVAVEVSRWDRNPRVLLLRFPSAAAQRDAMGRPSIFLEDAELHGTVVERIPSGQRGGVANYSGHNMRASDLARFLNVLRATRPGGAAETAAEAAMVRALKNVGALVTNKDGSFAAARDDPVLAAVAGSSDRNEVRDALLHEAMHMVFYVDAQYERACRDYWDAAVSDSDKDAWREFLTELRYNADDETLAVNELQAYMTTERVMFDDGGGGNKGGGNRGGGGNNGGRGGEKIETLARMQREFAAHIKTHASMADPPSVGANTKVVWL
tara:strand:- start:25 stop:1038 length:1014 start_codon:yes stop_codon:yes gene_type:complete